MRCNIDLMNINNMLFMDFIVYTMNLIQEDEEEESTEGDYTGR